MYNKYTRIFASRNYTIMGEDFKWTDELAYEYRHSFDKSGNYLSIEDFKQSKQNSNKDWEIVMFKDLHDSATPFRTVKDRDNSISESEMLNSSRYEIQSVRRKSDNEVFSVGGGCSGFGYEEISHFTIAGKEMIASFKSGIFSNIDFLFKKAKQKLFTTEDGKDIYEGDEYWILFIESGSSWIPSNTKASEHTIADVTKSYMKRFSTEELAKEYAIMHKPCLSLDDLLSAWGGGDGKSKEYYANAPLFLNFKKLVEEKINNGERQ